MFCGVRSGCYKAWIQSGLLVACICDNASFITDCIIYLFGSILPKLAHKNSSECFQKVIELIKIRRGQSTSHPRVGLPALDGE